MKIGLISFAAPPATGGGAVYVRLLADAVNASKAHDLHVFAERTYRGEPTPSFGPNVRIHRLFSRRATAQGRGPKALIAFAAQQAQLVELGRRLEGLRLDSLLVHAALLRHPTPIDLLLSAANRAGTTTVLDVRDVGYPPARAAKLSKFDSVIACAEAPQAHIAQISGGAIKPEIIPVIFRYHDASEEDRSAAAAALSAVGIGPNDRFVLMSGGLTYAKGAPTAAAVSLALKSHGLPIVSCGPVRLEDRVIDEARQAGTLRYLGRVPHGVHTAILERASCLASFSIQEGLPRTFLEAITLNKPLFAPTVVPEFSHLPQLSGSPPQMATQIATTLKGSHTQAEYDYDITQHDAPAVLARLVEHLLSCKR